MSAFYTYIVEPAQSTAVSGSRTPKVLDYGCGAGLVVKIACERGVDAYGVDLFYGGGNTLEAT